MDAQNHKATESRNETAMSDHQPNSGTAESPNLTFDDAFDSPSEPPSPTYSEPDPYPRTEEDRTQCLVDGMLGQQPAGTDYAALQKELTVEYVAYVAALSRAEDLARRVTELGDVVQADIAALAARCEGVVLANRREAEQDSAVRRLTDELAGRPEPLDAFRVCMRHHLGDAEAELDGLEGEGGESLRGLYREAGGVVGKALELEVQQGQWDQCVDQAAGCKARMLALGSGEEAGTLAEELSELNLKDS